MKVLHLGFHSGVQNDLDYIAQKLGFHIDFKLFSDGENTNNCTLYSVGHDRAATTWKNLKDMYNQYDLIITSDTAPISRVFLQNNWSKPLIIWICNRIDYFDANSRDCEFPDKEYFDLMNDVKNRPNVTIMGYTAFENYYANNVIHLQPWGKPHGNMSIGDKVLTPIGKLSKQHLKSRAKFSIVPKTPEKAETFLCPPYHNDKNMINMEEKLRSLGIKAINSRYNGPVEMAEYKGIIHIPYAWSNLALFEANQLGVIHFIPSKEFFLELIETHNNFFWSPPFRPEALHLAEWYNEKHADLFVYFNSWEDLVEKVESLDYPTQKRKIYEHAIKHHNETLDEWKNILGL